jgi:amylosucrase
LWIEHALRRILLIHGVILSYGGIPLIYLGDEIGLTNDYTYQHDPAKQGDSRWVHRVQFDWAKADQRHQRHTLAQGMYSRLHHMLIMRQQTEAFTSGDIQLVQTHNPHVLGFMRVHVTGPVIVLANFSEQPQRILSEHLHDQGLGLTTRDLITGTIVSLADDVPLAPYQLCWLQC